MKTAHRVPDWLWWLVALVLMAGLVGVWIWGEHLGLHRTPYPSLLW